MNKFTPFSSFFSPLSYEIAKSPFFHFKIFLNFKRVCSVGFTALTGVNKGEAWVYLPNGYFEKTGHHFNAVTVIYLLKVYNLVEL